MKKLKFLLPFSLIVVTSAFFFSAKQQSAVIKLKLIAEGLTAPVAMESPKDGTGRLFICEQTGKIKIVKNGVLLEKPFLDVTAKLDKMSKAYSEKGLLGLVFHPNYKTNGRFFIYYSAPSANKNSEHKSIVAEYKVSADADIANETSHKIIIEIEQPESNHNGGQLAFGADGFLYIGLGDGGGAGDEHGTIGNGQDLTELLGKILRIDVDKKSPYAIPSDNPFVKNPYAKHEIWAYGLRNPWRFSFDSKTGKLFCADVGQNEWEEIDIIEKGKNYGWRIMEGSHCYNPETNCNQKGLSLPIAEYNHDVGISVTGGYVYRGKNIPALQGKYIFGDWKGELFYLEETQGKWKMQNLIIEEKKGNDLGININSFGEDETGEIYIISQKYTGLFAANGRVYLITK